LPTTTCWSRCFATFWVTKYNTPSIVPLARYLIMLQDSVSLAIAGAIVPGIAGRPSPRSVGLLQPSVRHRALNWFACRAAVASRFARNLLSHHPKAMGHRAPRHRLSATRAQSYCLPPSRTAPHGAAQTCLIFLLRGGSVWARLPFGPVARLAGSSGQFRKAAEAARCY